MVGSSPVSAVGTIIFNMLQRFIQSLFFSAWSTNEYIVQICLRCVKDASPVRDSCISLRMRWRRSSLEVDQESFINRHPRRTFPKAVQVSFITKHRRRTSPKVCHSSTRPKVQMPLLLMLDQCSRCVNFKLCQDHWGCTTPQLYHSENYMWKSFQLGMKMIGKVH